MGPLRLIDEIGVDITIDIGNTLEKAYGQRDRVPSVLLWLRDQQMLGRKTGAGFYKYEGKRQTPNDSLVEWRRGSVVAGDAEPGRAAVSPVQSGWSPATDVDLLHRLIFLMVNEAARCVEERCRRFSRGCGLRNDFRNRFCAVLAAGRCDSRNTLD